MYPYYLDSYYFNPDTLEYSAYQTPYSEGYVHPAQYDERVLGQIGQILPPMGPPPGASPGFPPSGPPFGQGPQQGAPTAPPPSFVPAKPFQQASTFAVDPGSIRRCLFRYTYIWLRNFQQFWFYPVFIGRTSISGYRWNGFRWLFFGVSLRQIESFTCV
ncbi:hypothetical protein [Bacillus marasmi]|uniref:hypothetical protein n=1 Tax=Bacillus marasmi TaxID=1926279 RepID=UPI0011C84485|nr:hypothetical protein [Bacillus marasmi]